MGGKDINFNPYTFFSVKSPQSELNGVLFIPYTLRLTGLFAISVSGGNAMCKFVAGHCYKGINLMVRRDVVLPDYNYTTQQPGPDSTRASQAVRIYLHCGD